MRQVLINENAGGDTPAQEYRRFLHAGDMCPEEMLMCHKVTRKNL